MKKVIAIAVLGLCLSGCANLQSGLNTALTDVQNAQQKVTNIPPTATSSAAQTVDDAFAFGVDLLRAAIGIASVVQTL